MKTTTSFLIALLAANTCTLAQSGELTAGAKTELDQRIARMVLDGSGSALDSSLTLDCTVLEMNEGQTGTGAGLVMYQPARVHCSVQMVLRAKKDGSIIWSKTVYAIGRHDRDEAVDDAVERMVQQLTSLFLPQPGATDANVIASGNR